MSDYRNLNGDFTNPEDPLRRDPRLDPGVRTANTAWGWIAGAIFVVVVLAIAFGVGHTPNQAGSNTLANNAAPPAVTHMAPPANGTASPAFTPAPKSNTQP